MRNTTSTSHDLAAFGEELTDQELTEVSGGGRIIIIVFGDGTVIVIRQN